jgi:hypothetical protein
VVAGAVTLPLAALPAAAQDAPVPTAESGLTVGSGVGISNNGLWFGDQLGFHRPSRDWLIRGGVTWDFGVLSNSDAIAGLAVLRGWRSDTPGGTTWRRIAVGLGVDYTEVYTEDESGNCGLFGCSQTLDERTGVGLAVQGDVGFDVGGAVGLSLTGQGSLNTATSWFAVGVMLTLGPTSMYR